MMNPIANDSRKTHSRQALRRTLTATAAGAMIAAIGLSGAGASTAQTDKPKPAKIQQPACGKFKGKKLNQCKANATVREIVGEGRYFGTFADGEPIDTIYCLNGATQDQARLNTDPERAGWKVTSAKVKDKKHFTAILKSRSNKQPFDRSVSRKGKTWKVGYVTKKGKPKNLQPVKRTPTVVVSATGSTTDLCAGFGTKLKLPPLPTKE